MNSSIAKINNQPLWACVLFENSRKTDIVPINSIMKFNPEHFDKKKKYFVKHNNRLNKALVLFLKGIFISF